jgi:3D (Asp-Asp-Asp) domain-containing protein
MTTIITAYCSCVICCGPHASGLDASGKVPIEGKTVAGPRRYKLGTKVLIDGKPYTITDRTAIRYDGRFDIYIKDHKRALKFGKKQLEVKIL